MQIQLPFGVRSGTKVVSTGPLFGGCISYRKICDTNPALLGSQRSGILDDSISISRLLRHRMGRRDEKRRDKGDTAQL